ncbi:hypothetical protein BT63DRAFT_412758 [Microthyrium microscopicum]|uniref:Uncharacterized protein n=1 Tax=Microthyrium microscopicum TaxID=703497 RepID=A0A6A6UDS1_9PEZI|nr:hypothetical protein BT63DRAFT_412758 [Microthyrium microscopicum]
MQQIIQGSQESNGTVSQPDTSRPTRTTSNVEPTASPSTSNLATPSTPSPSTSSAGKISPGGKAGIAIGVIGLCVIMGATYFFVARNKVAALAPESPLFPPPTPVTAEEDSDIERQAR